MITAFLNMLQDEDGQGLIEYALIIALVSVVAIAALTLMGKRVNNTMNATANALNGVPDP